MLTRSSPSSPSFTLKLQQRAGRQRGEGGAECEALAGGRPRGRGSLHRPAGRLQRAPHSRSAQAARLRGTRPCNNRPPGPQELTLLRAAQPGGLHALHRAAHSRHYSLGQGGAGRLVLRLSHATAPGAARRGMVGGLHRDEDGGASAAWAAESRPGLARRGRGSLPRARRAGAAAAAAAVATQRGLQAPALTCDRAVRRTRTHRLPC